MNKETSKTQTEQQEDMMTMQRIVELGKDMDFVKNTMGGFKTDVTKSMDELKTDIKAFITEVRNGYVTKYEHNSLIERVKSLEATHTWLNRLVLGIVVGAIVAAAFTLRSVS